MDERDLAVKTACARVIQAQSIGKEGRKEGRERVLRHDAKDGNLQFVRGEER